MRKFDVRQMELADLLWLSSLNEARLSFSDWPRLKRILMQGAAISEDEAEHITYGQFLDLVQSLQAAVKDEAEQAVPFANGDN